MNAKELSDFAALEAENKKLKELLGVRMKMLDDMIASARYWMEKATSEKDVNIHDNIIVQSGTWDINGKIEGHMFVGHEKGKIKFAMSEVQVGEYQKFIDTYPGKLIKTFDTMDVLGWTDEKTLKTVAVVRYNKQKPPKYFIVENAIGEDPLVFKKPLGELTIKEILDSWPSDEEAIP